jgi:uncharacterized protein (UPF0264 family)
MQLLVSLRAADEVTAALAGGADIIDAKEPARGPLGAVAPEVLEAISAAVPATVAFSAALGDFTAADAVRSAVAAAGLAPRLAPVYLKLGFAGASPGSVPRLVATALAAASEGVAHPVIVPVAYADCLDARSPEPEEILHAAITAGAHAILLDTYTKDGVGLLARLEITRVRALATRARAAGLLVALAGSLDPAAIGEVLGLADVIGVRGSACVGGRGGRVNASLVRRIRDRLPPPTTALPAAG